MQVTVDIARCEGYANCLIVAPEVFTVDDEDKVELLRSEVTPDQVADVEEAVRNCPTSALGLTD